MFLLLANDGHRGAVKEKIDQRKSFLHCEGWKSAHGRRWNVVNLSLFFPPPLRALLLARSWARSSLIATRSSLRPDPRAPLRAPLPCGGRGRPRTLLLHFFRQKTKEALQNITSHVDRPVQEFVGRCAILIVWACAHSYSMFNRITEKLIEATTPKHCFPYHIAVVIIAIIRRRRAQ